MKLPVKFALAAAAAVALSLALTPVQAEPPNFDFDNGVDTAQVLEALRHQNRLTSIDKNTLPTIQWANAKSTASLKGPISGIDTIGRVQNSAPYEAALEYPPLIEVLEPAERSPLEAEWKIINGERAALLVDAEAFENEEWALYDRGVAIDQNADRLNDRAEKLSTEIDDFNRQCTGRPLPPGEYNACLRWKNDLERRLGEHEAEVRQHNAMADQWLREAADLKNRVGTSGTTVAGKNTLSFMGRVAAWEQTRINPFVDRATQALARAQMTSVRVQAQGGGLERSVKKNELRPVTLIEGNSMLDQLWLQLSPRQQEERAFAFEQARSFMRQTAAVGGVTAPPKVSRSFYNQNPNPPDARVDVEIFRGRAFVSADAKVR